MKREFSSNSDDVYGRRRPACAACLRSTPWWAFIAAALFAGGLAVWVAGAVKVQDYTIQVARTIDVEPSVTDALRTAVITAILAIGVSGLIVCLLVVLLALFKTGLSTALFSSNSCCSSGKAPEPWTFTTFRLLVGTLNAVVWVLLVAVVAVLMLMLVWYGLSVAVDAAISSSRAASGAFSSALNRASDSAAAAQAYLTPLVSSPAAAAELLGASSAFTLPFQPLCAPVCLNLGSFASLLRSASCVCGADKLAAISNAASQGVRVGAVALAGAAAMYVGATLLLVILTAQFVTAKYDRSAARLRARKAARDYENGFVADPADCFVPSRAHSAGTPQDAVAMFDAPSAPSVHDGMGAVVPDVRGQRDVLGGFVPSGHNQQQQHYPAVSHGSHPVNPFAKYN